MAKVAILGGGMAALSAAYQLTRTPALQAANQVTVYTLGWRLGGKAASGMDGWGRNLEHGLHVWFGCYQNTFQMIQQVYDPKVRPAPPPGQTWAFPTWQDAVKPQRFTPIGVQAADGSWSYFKFSWPDNGATPGDGTLFPTPWEMAEVVIGWIIEWLEGGLGPGEAAYVDAAGPIPAAVTAPATPANALRLAKPNLLTAVQNPSDEAAMARALTLIAWARDAHMGAVGGIGGDVLDIFLAVTTGLYIDILKPNQPLLSIDDLEFRAWLKKHGANKTVVDQSSVIRVVYDTLFQYQGGDATQPNLAAGTGIGVVLRLVATFKGSMMWEVQAGMGEVMVGPLYQQLLAQGVQFEFFSKVTNIQPGTSNGKPIVQSITLQPQAATNNDAPYNPVTVSGGLVHWPSEPDWTQLVNGPAMQSFGTNFESHWCAYPKGVSPPAPKPLNYNQDFDVVVLAIALGAFKPLNGVDVSLAQPLIDADPVFANWVKNVDIVPSIGVQLWCDETTLQLGWSAKKPACVSGPEYLDIWADMSQVIQHEPWKVAQPLSLHYLTGTWATNLYTQPASQAGTPSQAYNAVRTLTINWLNQYSALNWPNARAGGGFDWSVLISPNNWTGEGRIDDQWLRANVDPSECCTLSGAGTTKFRPHATSGYFTNLYFAGEGTTMGFTTSFEGSVMSGAAASQAICGSPEQIVGYDFLDVPPTQWGPQP